MNLKHLPMILALAAAPGIEAGEHGLVELMGHLQTFTHKLGLSIDAENRALIDFYAHEVEETLEKVEEIETFDGIAISRNLGLFLRPDFGRLEQAIAGGAPPAIDAAYDALLTACNHCHAVSKRPFIHIERRRENPFMQSFVPR